MKIVLPPRLRAGLLAALLLLTSFATSDAQAAGVAAQKEDLATASLGTESAYTLTETATPDGLTISKYVYDASSGTTTRVNYEVDIKPLGDTTGSGSPSYFAWSADEPLTLQSSTEAEAHVTAYAGNGNSVGETIDSAAFTNATGTTMAALSQDFVANTVNYGINHGINEENKISTSTGGALNNQGEMTLSTSHFVGNALIASNSAAGEIVYNVHGGAIHNTGSLGAMQSDFIGNLASVFSSGYQMAATGSASDYAARALGGAAYNAGNVSSFSGDFLANHVYAESIDTEYKNGATAYGGALFSTSEGSIGSITGTLSGNSSTAKTSGTYALALGGAVYNQGLITRSSADYTGNSTYVSGATGQASSSGGAMNNGIEGTIHYLESNFGGNHAKAEVTSGNALVTGGALSNAGQVYVLEGIYTQNRVEAISLNGIADARGGAIENNGSIGGIGGVLSANTAYAMSNDVAFFETTQARGGAIFNTGSLNEVSADFIGNQVHAKVTSNGNVAALGGAIFNDGTDVIVQVTGSFYGNSTQTEGGEEATSSGGAIANRGNLGLLAIDQNMEFTGNYSIKDGNKVSNAIYNESYFDWLAGESTPTLRMNAYDTHRIIVNDGISGAVPLDVKQYIEINSGLNGGNKQIDSAGSEFSTVEFNNRVEYQTITVHAGTLKLGSYAGGTITIGGEAQQVGASSALLYYSDLSVLADGRVTTDASYLGTNDPDDILLDTTISNSGTIELTSGTLSHAINTNDSGRIEIRDGVTLDAALTMNDSSSIEIYGKAVFNTAPEMKGSSSIVLHAGATLESALQMDEQSRIVFHAGSTLNSALTLKTTGGITNEDGDLRTLTSVTLGSMAQITDYDASTNASADLVLESCTLEVEIDSAMTLDAASGVSYLTAGVLADIASIEQSLTLRIDLTQEIADAFFAGLETEQLQGIWLQDSSALSAMSLDAGIDLTDDIIITLNGQQLTATQAVAHEGGLLLTTTRTIPEPSTATLSLLALSAMLLRRRRQVC